MLDTDLLAQVVLDAGLCEISAKLCKPLCATTEINTGQASAIFEAWEEWKEKPR